MRLSPLNDYLLVIEETQQETQTSSGIITGVGGNKNVGFAIVHAVGTLSPQWAHVDLKEGDRIIYSKFSLEEIVMKDEEGKRIDGLASVHCSSVLARVE